MEVTVSFNQFTDGTTDTSQSGLIPDGLTIKFSAAGDLSDREFKSSAHTVTKKIKMSTSEEEKRELEKEREKLRQEEESNTEDKTKK